MLFNKLDITRRRTFLTKASGYGKKEEEEQGEAGGEMQWGLVDKRGSINFAEYAGR